MNIKTKLLPLLIATATLAVAGCDSASESPFAPGGGDSSGTNIVSHKNLNMLFDEPNPPVLTDEGFDGSVEVEVTIFAADRLNLPTTGATAYIETDWGTLSAKSCQINSSGSCSVTWKATANNEYPFFPADEHVAFTAWIIGEESFFDLNGNGIFDDGDVFPNENDTAGPFLDLNHDGAFTQGVDQVLLPGNSNGTRTPANGLFDGQECSHSTDCSGNSSVYVSDRDLISIREAP